MHIMCVCVYVSVSSLSSKKHADTLYAHKQTHTIYTYTQMKKKHNQEIKSLKEAYKQQTKMLQEMLAAPGGFVITKRP
jgi:hypothetical protein